jgi:peptidyl-prolyl cis-trans isomerase SurA
MGRTGGKLLIALVACLIQLFLAGRGASEVVDRIVAEVNDDIITMSELKSMAKNFEAKQGIAPSPTEDREIQRQLLETLINRKLARVEAKKRGMGLTDKEMTRP